jgi:hypothetical protein
MKEVTESAYHRALETISRYKAQQDKTIQVSVTYKAKLNVTLRVPKDFTIEEIKSSLKDGYNQFRRDDEEDIELGKIAELYVAGEEVKL